MDKRFGTLCRHAAGFALVMTLGLALVPFVLLPSASFLGKDISALAVGVISFYPWIAAAEVVKILVFASSLAFIVGLAAAAGAAGLKKARWLIFPIGPAVAYIFWLLGAALKYPALFESSLSPWAQHALFRLGFVVAPSAFFGAATVVAMAPLALLLLRYGKYAAQPRVRVSVVGLLLAACSFLGIQRWRNFVASEDRPDHINVLFIGIDSLRSDRLLKAEVTPALQTLLADAQTISWRDHYVGIPRTFPSWIEILQGMPAASTGIRHMFPGFAERSKPFIGWVSQLQRAGYQTTVRSDFAGDIFPRFQAGFSRVLAPNLTIMTMIRLNMDQAFTLLLPMMVTGPFKTLYPALKESPAYGDPEHLGSDFREQLKLGTGAKPWLETLFFSTAHFPYAAPYPFYSMFSSNLYPGPYRFQKNPESNAGSDAADGTEIAQIRALYDGSIRAVDAELGLIFDQLKVQKLWDQTLIVVTADHGEDLFERDHLQGHGEHLRGENVLKVPVLMKLPKRLVPVVKDLNFTTRSIDIGATVLAAVGLAKPVGEGVDLLPWMTSAAGPAPKLAAYAETGLWFSRTGSAFFQKYRLDYPGISGLLNFDQGYSGEIALNPIYQQIMVTAKHRMMVDGDYKIIYMPTPQGVRYELYNRRLDPENYYDLSAKEPAVLAALRRSLTTFVGAHEPPSVHLVDQFLVPK
jgi:hypothetical protein